MMKTNGFSRSITPSLDSLLSTASMTPDSVFCHGSSFGCLSITPLEATDQGFSYVPTPLHSPRPETPRPPSNTARRLKYSPTSSIGTVPEDRIKTPSEGNFFVSNNKSSVIEGIEEPSSSQSLLIKNSTHLGPSIGSLTSGSINENDLEIIGYKIPVPSPADSNGSETWYPNIASSILNREQGEGQKGCQSSHCSLQPVPVDHVTHRVDPMICQNVVDVLKVKQQKSMQLMNKERRKILESGSEQFSEPTIKDKKTKKKYKADKRAKKDLVELPPVLHQRKKFFVLEGKKPHKLGTVPKISTKDEEFLSKMEFQLGMKSKLPSIHPDI